MTKTASPVSSLAQVAQALVSAPAVTAPVVATKPVAKKPAAKKAPKVHTVPAGSVVPPATPTATAVASTPAPSGIKFRLSGCVQGTLAGDRLLAHTTAFLECTEAYEGKSLPLWTTMVGSSALAYHKKAGRLVHAGDGYFKLSDEGIAFFKARKVARPLVDSYATAFQTGVIPEGLSKLPMIAV